MGTITLLTHYLSLQQASSSRPPQDMPPLLEHLVQVMMELGQVEREGPQGIIEFHSPLVRNVGIYYLLVM